MAMSEKFLFEELDAPSREYLLHARDRRGGGMPGVFVPKSNYLPGVGCFVGIAVLVCTAILAANLIEEEPLGVAMLETAGLLVGGWLVVYALRAWAAARSSREAGHFVFADAETLWECSGPTVAATDLHGVAEASSVEHFSKEGKYTHTAVTVRTSAGTRQFNVQHEGRAQILVGFCNALAWLRSGGAGDAPAVARHAAAPAPYRNLPAPIMGGLARELAERGEMPRDLSPDSLGLDVTDVPRPKKEGQSSSAFLHFLFILFVITGVGAGSVLAFKELNVGWRDDAIWSYIGKIDDHDQRAPWLRAYLADERNIKHRDDARQMLRTIYAGAVNRIRGGFIHNQNQFGNFNFPPVPGPGIPNLLPAAGAANDRIDDQLLDGLEVVLRELAEQPLALVSVSVKEKGNRDGAAEREKEMMEKYTVAVLHGVGEELIAFVKAPPDAAGMIAIDYVYERKGDGPGASWRCKLTFSFRKTTDGDVVKTVTREFANEPPPSVASVGVLADKLGLRTAGAKKLKLQPVEF
jgi:hypothetical protein